MTHDAEYEAKELEKLIGATITGVILTPGHYFGIRVLKKGKSFKVWIDSDQEGNSCGAVKIEPDK
jgi:predicted Ser/Thr protein kinase